MRTITLKGGQTFELWGGRRLFCATTDGWQIVALPQGAIGYTVHARNATLTFGSVGRTTLQVIGPKEFVKGLADAILEGARP